MREKTRQANIELLRSIAMIMVVVLHYLIKGNVAVSLADDFSVMNVIFWFIKALCIVAVNVYVLISGYFLLEAKWKISRLVKLWFQTMFYSIGVPLACLFLGIGEVNQWGRYDWINVLFPVQMEHYWFITAYIILYLMVPVLGQGVKHLTQRQHKLVIVGLLLVFSVPKTILPIGIPTDRYGYDFGWFVCLFMIAAYLRLYGMSVLEQKRTSLVVYFAAVCGICGVGVICAMLSCKGLPFAYMMDMAYSYNHLLVLIGAVAFFYIFKEIRIPEGAISNIICKVSKYTLGVYLLHENIAVRSRWQYWAGVEGLREGVRIIPHMLITIAAVFVAGVVVDFVRECIFKVVIRVWKKVFAGKTAKRKN